MALNFLPTSSIFFALFGSTVLLASPVNCRLNYSSLNISAMIEKTFLNHQSFLTEPTTRVKSTKMNDTRVVSFTIHPRVSISPRKNDKNYSELTLHRIAADFSRVKYISSRFESPITSGKFQGTGEYFTQVGIGNPTFFYYLVIDTGSELTWLQCQPYSKCYPQTDPIFDPTESSTYRPLPCSSPECKELPMSCCDGGNCHYSVTYGDGSSSSGELATELVSFFDSSCVENVPVGCGRENEGKFAGAAGILGLAQSNISLPTRIPASTFSYCLVDRDSNLSSTLDFNSPPPPDSVLTTMIINPKLPLFYYIDVSGISVAGERLAIPESVFQLNQDGSGGIIIDSGTTVTWLQPEPYEALRDAFVKKTEELQLPRAEGVSVFETCYNFSSVNSSLVAIPTISLVFSGGEVLDLNGENSLMPVDSSGTVCLAFAPIQAPVSILGNQQLSKIRVSYDLANKQLGFSPNKC